MLHDMFYTIKLKSAPFINCFLSDPPILSLNLKKDTDKCCDQVYILNNQSLILWCPENIVLVVFCSQYKSIFLPWKEITKLKLAK